MRVAVELRRAYQLLNHGPTVLVSAAHAGRNNTMAAAWNMPLDFSPPKVAVVVDKNTFTSDLLLASGEFVLAVPTVAQAPLTTFLGTKTGRVQDKQLLSNELHYEAASIVSAPLVKGCIAWLECEMIDEPQLAKNYDLILGEVLAAWADDRVWQNNRWVFEKYPDMRTIHHYGGGIYATLGETIDARL